MKTEEEADFFSIINETISNDDINFADFITIFKVLSNLDKNEEQIKNTLKEFFLDGGYELKEIKFEYTLKSLTDFIPSSPTKSKMEKEEKNLMVTSLSQLQTIKNNLIICCLTPMNVYMKTSSHLNFPEFWNKRSKDTKELKLISNLFLIYVSDTKVRGLYDSQYMFPDLFKVKHIFQLILSKSIKENVLFKKHLEEYENCISYNSFHIAQKKIYDKLSELNNELENNIHTISSNKNSFLKFTENFEILKNFYLNNEKFQNFSCALTHLTYIGNNDCLKRFSSEISFNNNFFIINYDKENDCDELIKLFMELPEEMDYYYRFRDISLFRPQNFSSFQRIILILKPFICRNNLNDILLNIFKVNNFKILTRKTIVLNDDDSNYLYYHECPNQDVSFNNYHHMMTDSKCEIVLLSKFRAFSEAHAILGSNNSVLTSNKGQLNNNFINIYSLINREISKLLEKNEKNNLNLNINKDNKHIERDFLEFSSKINLYFYLSNNMEQNEEEINYFCPEFCYMQDIIIICKTYTQNLEETLISFKYEILDKCYYRFEEYEIDRIFRNIYKEGDTESAFESLKTYFLSNDICLMRIIKPGSGLEYNNILFDIVKFYNSFELSNLDNNSNYFDNKYEFIKKNCFLVTEPEIIEYLFKIINDQVYKIEGNIIINKFGSPEKNETILKIIKNCIKCTVGEDIREDGEEFTGDNDSIIHRYMQFYHQDYINEGKRRRNNNSYMESDYYMNCINEYFNNYCKQIYNRTYGTKSVSKFYSEIIDPNNMLSFREILINHFSFIIESNNLGFYEIRIPLMDCVTKHGWTFIESDKYLLNKYYLYPENDFYKDLADKNHEKNILMYELPFDGLIYNINNYVEQNDGMITNTLLNEVETSLTKYLGTNYMYKTKNNDNTEEIKNIIRYLIYKTKFESNKIFNHKSIMTDLKKTIVPRNYHYRIEPNKLYMDINRIYEVEEFTGLNFLEMVIQDYMKFRPVELNKTLDDLKNERVLRKQYNYRNRFEERQFPLTPLLWGRKLNKICKIIEEQKHNLNYCENYGPIIFIPIKNQISGIIRKDFVKDYEIYLYMNLFEDIKIFIHQYIERFDEILTNENRKDIAKKIGNGFDIKEMADYELILEKKLYEVFNSDIFDRTRNNPENIKLVPNRIEPNNVRINKSLKSIERTEKKDMKNTYKMVSSIKLDYEKNYHDIFKSSENIDKVDYDIINKNVYLTDIFCFNGMKYHMFASLYFLLNIIYKRINRQTELLSTYFDKSNKNITEINEEYDIIIDSIIKGFMSQSYINYKKYNDSKRYNAYLIEYFFYCLSEIKYYINEVNYFSEKINKIDIAINTKFKGKFNEGLFDEYNEVIKGDHEEFLELTNIKENMEKILNEDFKIINIILKEAIICPLQQSEDELSDYKNIYAPKERYYIPMFLNEKWERNLDNDKYKRLERVDKFLLNKLDNLKEGNEREIFYNTGYELSNDYYLVERNLLREPDPPISDKILLEKKKYDKTGYKNKVFKNLLGKNKGLNMGNFGKKLIGLGGLGKTDKKDINENNSNFESKDSLSIMDKSLGSKTGNSNNNIINTNINSNIDKNTSNTIKNNTFFNLFKGMNFKKSKVKFNEDSNIINNKTEDSKIPNDN